MDFLDGLTDECEAVIDVRDKEFVLYYSQGHHSRKEIIVLVMKTDSYTLCTQMFMHIRGN